MVRGTTRLKSHPDKGGRRPAIPVEAWPVVFHLRELGLSYARIAQELDRQGHCWSSRGSVERLLKSLGCYSAGMGELLAYLSQGSRV